MRDPRFTGIYDIDNQPIYEGDEVWCYPDTRKVVPIQDEESTGEFMDEINSMFGDMFEVVGEPTGNFLDVPILVGKIEWSPPQFILRYLNPTETGAISNYIWANGYTLVKQI